MLKQLLIFSLLLQESDHCNEHYESVSAINFIGGYTKHIIIFTNINFYCNSARFMHIFGVYKLWIVFPFKINFDFIITTVSSRYWNYAGEAHARLSRDQSIYGELGNQHSWVIKILSVILFFAPNVHFKNIQKMWVDQISYAACWGQMLEVLNVEWNRYIILVSQNFK